MSRNDVHSPKNLVTEDYEYMFACDTQTPWAVGVDRDWLRELNNFAPDMRDRGQSQCHHCGAHVRYIAFLKHVPTGYTIVVGETCLDNRFDVATVEFHRMRKAAELDRAKMRIKNLIAAFCEENPDLAWMGEKETPAPYNTNGFLMDVARKLRKYGEISAAQYNAVVRVAGLTVAPPEPEEPEFKAPVVEGRIKVEGRVISTKWHDSDYGGSLKMTVKDDRGFLVWGSVPSSLDNVEKGMIVRFTAQVTKSDRDETFGFFKRPTKAEVVDVMEVAV